MKAKPLVVYCLEKNSRYRKKTKLIGHSLENFASKREEKGTPKFITLVTSS